MPSYEDVYEKLSTLAWLLRKHQIKNSQKRGTFIDPNHGQGRVLTVLKMQSPIATKGLAYILGIRPQSLNELLQKLEKGGYIERVPSEQDGRVLLVMLTDKGRNVPEADTGGRSIFAELSSDELEQFSASLDKIISSLQDDVGNLFDENFFEWMKDARARMTDEQFAELLSVRQGIFEKFGFGKEEKTIFGRDASGGRAGWGWGKLWNRNPVPKGMPGAERFDPDYDGPAPGDRQGSPFDRKAQDEKPPDEERS